MYTQYPQECFSPNNSYGNNCFNINIFPWNNSNQCSIASNQLCLDMTKIDGVLVSGCYPAIAQIKNSEEDGS